MDGSTAGYFRKLAQIVQTATQEFEWLCALISFLTKPRFFRKL